MRSESVVRWHSVSRLASIPMANLFMVFPTVPTEIETDPRNRRTQGRQAIEVGFEYVCYSDKDEVAIYRKCK